MVNVTLSIPDELKDKMDSFAEINWSAVAREAFAEKVRDLELIKRFKAKSTMTEQDAIRLGRELSEKLSKRRKTG
jgi:predicted transcriptional regulator